MAEVAEALPVFEAPPIPDTTTTAPEEPEIPEDPLLIVLEEW